MIWSKKSDWLPLTNAKAQVEFYRKDLDYSATYLKFVQRFEGKGLKGFSKILKIAKSDWILSMENLRLAEIKLDETKEVEKEEKIK